MPENTEADELELRIVNALQVSPRAPWTLIGSVLDVDPATAARRWQRLTESGRAWTTVYPSEAALRTHLAAFIEVECAAGAADTVATRLAGDTRVGTIEHITGSADLLLTVFHTSLASLSDFLLTELGTTPGITGTRAHVATSIAAEGSRWTLRSLTGEQRRRLQTGGPRHGGPAPRLLGPRDQPLLDALAEDGRATYTGVAAATGASPSTVRRRLDSLLASGQIIIRCEVGQPLSGWPVSASLWCRIPPARLHTVSAQLSSLPETRLCAGITGGKANLLVSVWLRSVQSIQHLQTALAEQITDLEVLHTALALRHVKRMGRILDVRGRAAGTVRLKAWT